MLTPPINESAELTGARGALYLILYSEVIAQEKQMKGVLSCELATMFEQLVRPVVHDARHQRFHVAEFTVHAQYCAPGNKAKTTFTVLQTYRFMEEVYSCPSLNSGTEG
jgi:hypothetical protein